MNNKAIQWIYVSLLGFVLLLAFLLISSSYKSRLEVSLTSYFFLLIICALAATAFLNGALKSSAFYQGKIFNGNIKLAGPAVVFFLILVIGYRFKPVERKSPFNLTISLSPPSGDEKALNGKLILLHNNEPKEEQIDKNGYVRFTNLNPAYLGNKMHINAQIDGYKISSTRDTMIAIPNDINPSITIRLLPQIDSVLYSGFLVNKDNHPIANATISFPSFQRRTQSDQNGMFHIFLTAKPGNRTDIVVVTNDNKLLSDKIYIGKSIKIVIDD